MSGVWQAGVDTGGTFIDVVALNPQTGEVRAAKVRTDGNGRIAGIRAALAAVGLVWEDIADLVHGTTMATNAVVEDKLASVALIATQGFSDTLEIGRQNRRHLYRLDLPPKTAPQAPAERRFEVAERLDHNGDVVTPLTAENAAAAARAAAASGAEAVAVSLMHAYANAEHEEALGSALDEYVSRVALSSRVNPEAREYERMATTVLSASLMPLTAGYLEALEAAKPVKSGLHLFHSAGGMGSPEVLRELPLGLALSGPAAGVAAAGRIAAALGIEHAISFDMGGTTTDVCLITDGKAEIDSDRSIADRPMRQPMVAVETIGAGGGSIAALDHGALTVGPRSAGAEPGPACYGRGGTLPTVTDANVLLGYLGTERALGGEIRLNRDLARQAITPLAEAIGVSPEVAALGILRVANASMTRALSRITVERGIDGRGCTLVAFGGAGPMHTVAVAREFGISRIVVPTYSSVFSALGCVSAEKSYAQQQTIRMPSSGWDSARAAAAREALRARLAQPLLAAGHDKAELAVEAVAGVRYSGQSYAVEVAEPALDDPDALGDAFRAAHEQLYGFSTDEDWELVSLRLRVFVPRTGFAVPGEQQNLSESDIAASDDCIFDSRGALPTARLNRARLAAGKRIDGPAVIEDDWSTVVLPPGASLTPDGQGNLHIDAGEAP